MSRLETIYAALEIMWKGMLGIFVTIMVIMAIVWIMTLIGKKNSDKSSDEK